MKSIGERAHDFRVLRGWSFTRMAAEVTRHHTAPVSRQAITQLEDAGNRRPQYLYALAITMGVSADDLLSGKDSVAAAPAESEASVTPEVAIKSLTNWLSTMDASAQAQAATLLENMAREPAGPWSSWLVDLFYKDVTNNVKKQQTAKFVSKEANQTDITDYSSGSSPDKPSPRAPFAVVTPQKTEPMSPQGPDYGLGELDTAPKKTPDAERQPAKRLPKQRNTGTA
jgi:transcriptional regulator with XRE-family HTH domain